MRLAATRKLLILRSGKSESGPFLDLQSPLPQLARLVLGAECVLGNGMVWTRLNTWVNTRYPRTLKRKPMETSSGCLYDGSEHVGSSDD
jgi:hypothetical protein